MAEGLIRPHARSGALLLLPLAGVLLASCGAVQRAPHTEQVLSDVPARSIYCAPETYPAELPPANAVLDSAGLASSVADLIRRDTVPVQGHVLITLAFDEEGTSTRRAVIEHATTPALADSIQRLLFNVRREVEEADSAWGVRVRLDLGDPVRMRVGRRESCPPVPRDRRLAAAMEGYSPVGFRYRGGVGERIVHMRSLIATTGNVTTSHMERGGLRGSQLERDIGLYLRQFLFVPATVDGFDTSAWVIIPVRIVD
jgi:hypothetical protein